MQNVLDDVGDSDRYAPKASIPFEGVIAEEPGEISHEFCSNNKPVFVQEGENSSDSNTSWFRRDQLGKFTISK